MLDNMSPVHPMVSVAELMRQYKMCWDLGCTTCGALGLKSLCAMLDQASSIGRVVGMADVDSTDGHMIYKVSIREAERVARHELLSSGPSYHLPRNLAKSHRKDLIQILASAPLLEVARAGGFPDWLGVLGIALYLVQPSEPVTESWCKQFLEMGGSSDFWMDFYPNSRRLLGWEHLETAETMLLGYPETDLF